MADTWPVNDTPPEPLFRLGPPRRLHPTRSAATTTDTPRIGAIYPQPITFGGAPTLPDRGGLTFPTLGTELTSLGPNDFSLGKTVDTGTGTGGAPKGTQYVQVTRDPRAQWLGDVKGFANDVLRSIGAYGDQALLQPAGFFSSAPTAARSGGMSPALIIGGLAVAAYLLVRK